MLLLPILFLGIYLYLREKRVSASIIFFFFLSDGFQVVPLSLFDTHLGFNKPLDFCFIYTIVLFCFGLLKYNNFIPKKDIIGKSIFLFLSIITLIMIVNKSVFQVPLKEIIQTGRHFFILLSYFLFIRLSDEEIDKIHRILFVIVILQCLLFFLQVITSRPILTGHYGGTDMGLPFKRFYNLPLLLYYYVFYSIVKNPYTGLPKWATVSIAVLTLMLPMHRSLMSSFFLTIFIVSFLRGKLKEVAKYLIIASIIILPSMSFIMSRLSKGDTENDINNVMSGVFKEYVQDNNNMFDDGTFLFRLAHLYERFLYCTENPWNLAFGVGFMAEGSSYTNQNLDFKIGIVNKEENAVYQVDTSDIAWSNFIIRLGFIGTIAFFILYIAIFRTLFKYKSNPDSVTGIMFFVLLLIISVTSSNLYYVWMFALPFLDITKLRRKLNYDETGTEQDYD